MSDPKEVAEAFVEVVHATAAAADVYCGTEGAFECASYTLEAIGNVNAAEHESTRAEFESQGLSDDQVQATQTAWDNHRDSGH
jgi:hypothetical protein